MSEIYDLTQKNGTHELIIVIENHELEKQFSFTTKANLWEDNSVALNHRNMSSAKIHLSIGMLVVNIYCIYIEHVIVMQ